MRNTGVFSCPRVVLLLPSSCTAFSQVFAVNWFRWRIWDERPGVAHSRPQSLRSFWPAAGIESSGSNHFEITKEITEFCPSGLTQSSSMAHARNGCSQSSRFLPQARRIVGSGDENGSSLDKNRVRMRLGSTQKERGLWGRECRCLLILARHRGLYSWAFVNFYVHQETEGAHYLIDVAIRTNSIILTK